MSGHAEPAGTVEAIRRRTKVCTIVGTRPEIIRLSRVVDRLDSNLEHVLVHTGQNWDFALGDIFISELGLRKPDHHLGVEPSSLGVVLGETLIRTEEVLEREKPDAVLVLGDTNSCISGLIAKRMHIPVYHMEAGNRSFDQNVPEEVNRRLVDHISDFNLVYTEHARRHLLSEGLHPRRVLLTGSPMKEVLDFYRSDIRESDVLERLGVEPYKFFIVSAHREENVDDPDRLSSLLRSLRAVRDRWHLPVFVSTHPRTRKRLESLADLGDLRDITLHPPFGFFDYIKLQESAFCTLSDSGTISEESAILGFPAVTIRESMERPESLDAASIVMCGLQPSDVCDAVHLVTTSHQTEGVPDIAAEYKIPNCSQRVLRFIVSTARRHHEWAGIRGKTKG